MIDKQLLQCKGWTRFIQYFPFKLANYAIKIWWACEVKKYLFNSQLYTGKTDIHREINQDELLIIYDLRTPFMSSWRNFTVDNFFSFFDQPFVILEAHCGRNFEKKRNLYSLRNEFHVNRASFIHKIWIRWWRKYLFLCFSKRNKADILMSSMLHDKITTVIESETRND